MCTVTIIPCKSGIRLACNRDELRTRPAGAPPRILTLGERQVVMPIDPQSGGTWVAVSDAGLAFALLNVNPRTDRTDGTNLLPMRSRGTIIPVLASAATLAEVTDRVTALPLTDFAPFRLVVADRNACGEFRFDGERIQRTWFDVKAGPLLFTSSGLGDSIVDKPRRELFNEFFADEEKWPDRQDAFHRHVWPDRRHLSVCMSRPEARTVSLTVVELDANSGRMTYFPGSPDQATMALPSVTIPTRMA